MSRRQGFKIDRYLHGFHSLLATQAPATMPAKSQATTIIFATDFIDVLKWRGSRVLLDVYKLMKVDKETVERVCVLLKVKGDGGKICRFISLLAARRHNVGQEQPPRRV